MEKKTNIFRKFKNSLYNIKEVPKYIKEGVGRAILYALVFSVLVGLANGIATVYRLNESINSTTELLKEDKYKFKIENGILNINNSPINLEQSNTLFYLDDEKTLDQADDLRNITAHVDAYVLLLKDGLIINSNTISITGMNDTKVKYTDITEEAEITNENIISILNLFSKMIFAIVIIAAIITGFISLLFNSLLVALASMLTNNLLGLRLKLQEVFSLAIYAATLPMIIVTILSIIRPDVYFDSAGLLGTLLYSFFVLRNIKKERDSNINIQ